MLDKTIIKPAIKPRRETEKKPNHSSSVDKLKSVKIAVNNSNTQTHRYLLDCLSKNRAQ